MSHYSWDEKRQAMTGSPYPEVYIRNVRAQPLGDGNLKLLLVNHPLHAAVWDAMEEHGLSNEVALILDGETYYYYAEVTEEDAPAIFLFPMDDVNESLPPNERFMNKAFNLKLRW